MSDYCVCCGAELPCEGVQVCYKCYEIPIEMKCGGCMLNRQDYKDWMLYMIPFYFGVTAGKSDNILNMVLLMFMGMLVVHIMRDK